MVASDKEIFIVLSCFKRPDDAVFVAEIMDKVRDNGLLRLGIAADIQKEGIVTSGTSVVPRLKLTEYGQKLWRDIIK